MAKTWCVILCCCVALQSANCQFGFFRPKENQSPLNVIGQGILQAPNRIREGIQGLFRPNRPRPVVNQDNPVNQYVTEPGYVNMNANGQNGPMVFGQGQNNGNGNFQIPTQGNNNNMFIPNDGNGVNFVNNAQNDQSNNGIQDNYQQNGGQDNVPYDPVNFGAVTPAGEVTTLPQLTPVPNVVTGSENKFDFSSPKNTEPCTTVDGGNGNCITVYDCTPYMKLLNESKEEAIKILRKAHCGFQGNTPKVCCPLPGFSTEPPQPSPTTVTTTSTTSTTTTTTATPTSTPEPSGKSMSNDFVEAMPEPPDCGLSNATFGRVVGGVDAKLGSLPWMALLGYHSRRGGTSWLCGGSLITSRHTLTAAHCIHNHETDLYVVRLGELDLSREDEGATPTDVIIKEKIKHEQYSPTGFTNDIGILIFEHDVTFTDLIKPICMPRDNELRARNFEDYNPLIAGWGHTEFRGPAATHLQVLQLPVVSNDFCAQAYSQYKAQTIDQRVLCAGFKTGGKDACQGDSGGPLMQPIWSPTTFKTFFYQIGVVSYGKKCAEAGFPGVYTRVTHFVPWIEEKVLGRTAR